MRRVRLIPVVRVMVVAIPAWASAAIKIAKIQYDPPARIADPTLTLNQEYVVIKNTETKAAALTGWTLRDQQHHVFKFGTFKLAAGRSVTVHTGRGSDDRNDLYWGSSGVRLEQRR
jgi:hypothetical protein